MPARLMIIYYFGDRLSQLQEHTIMASEFVDMLIADLLASSNGLSNQHAAAIVLSGFSDVWEAYPDEWNALLQSKNLTPEQLLQLGQAHLTNATGSPCPDQ